MSASRREEVASIVTDMEMDVYKIRSWALALQTMGSARGLLDPSGVDVMGDALKELAERIILDWDRLFQLENESACEAGADPCA
ncbi:hypothetical protein [Methylobacterium soli]|uniref:Uncharacterized protein n=1 Tax=Methylobacterium soli TaxID=553447 RepID=A0A6L3SYJ4_9HYPH|nr:hypothetical protein [Methylobacterium soli]KAB1074589.1 hypothetical protein F6X53_25735 [Methylobacterium soli]GJE42257.1 hypothetical protein AEGHOMDF_1429 [Methylobacterium soli]